MKSQLNSKSLMTIFGGLSAVFIFSLMTVIFRFLPSSPAFIKISELAAELTTGNFSESKESTKDPAETDEAAPEIIDTSHKDDGIAQSLIMLSGFAYEFEAEDENAQMPEEEMSPSQISGEIVRKTYSYSPTSTIYELPFGGLMRNDTDIDKSYLLEQCLKEPAVELNVGAEPLVLIMHTHTTESYEAYAKEHYDESDSSRSTELSETVVAVGDKIAKKLTDAGIGVVHDTTVFDYPNYSGAYDRSAERIIEILEEYPSIEIVIDVHRDAIESDGVRYAPIAEIEGKTAAQVMIICGCMNVPQYRYNLRLASRLQSIMETNYPGLTRPLLFSERNYNQELTKGSFLIEMGSSANSLEEALYSGELVGECLKELILEPANE